MRKNKYKIIIGVIICLILVVPFFIGNNVARDVEQKVGIDTTYTEPQTVIPPTVKEEIKLEVPEEKVVFVEQAREENIEKNEAEKEGEGEPVITSEPEEPLNDNEILLTCTLSVSCKAVLDNMETLKEGKKGIIPPDGVIFEEKTVEFFEEESVFDVIHREMKNNNIHFEFVNTPMYNSAYIEGIGNLYECDCGDYSGWMYSVNGIKPTYGCSEYKVKTGDRIEFYYSCNFMNER